jgi:hypothetical protein
MKNYFLKTATLFALFFCFFSCENIPNNDETGGDDIPVRRVLVTPRPVSVRQGQTRQFSAQVEGYNKAVPDQSVVWSIVGEHEAETAIDQNGLLTVSAAEEPNSVFTVKATASADSSKSGSSTVTVVEAPAIESIAVDPAATTVAQGFARNFGAYIMVRGEADKTVLWELVAPDGKEALTTMDPSTGELKVAANEQIGRVFTVKVTSVFDPTKTAEGTVTVAENMPFPTMVGSFWFWPSLQLYFISPERVMLTSCGGYYPYSEGSPFRYYYPAQGYSYPYTYDPEKKTGHIYDNMQEYGYGLLGFSLPPDNHDLYFANYKSYGHSADFFAVRPPPPGGFVFEKTLPAAPSAADMAGSVWMGEISGTDFGGIAPGKHPVIIYFDSDTHAYITRTYDVHTEKEKRRKFGFSCANGAGVIDHGIGAFTVQSAANTITLENFPGAGEPLVFKLVYFTR